MKILVAGATGVIGRPLLPLLVRAGHDVSGTTRRADRAGRVAALGVRPIVIDLFDRDRLIAAVAAERPDVVMHQLTDLSDQDFAANARLRIDGTRNLVDAAKTAGVRRIIVQSIPFFYAPGDGVADESTPLDLGAPPPRRGGVEAVASLEAAASEIEAHVILRYGALYGPGTWHAADGAIADRLRAGTATATRAITPFLHVDDAARAAVAALAWPSGVVNVVDDEAASGATAIDWMPVLASAIGAAPPAIDRDADATGRLVSNAKLRRTLGFELAWPSWREGFARAVAEERGE